MRRAVFRALFLIGALLPFSSQAQSVHCTASNDTIASAICASPPMLEREIGLVQNFAGALLLVDEAHRKVMRVEQSEWENERRKAARKLAAE